MRSLLKLFIMASFAAVVMIGCYPNEDLYYSDLDVAATRYDEDFTFETDMVCVLIADVKWASEDETIREKEIPNEQSIIDDVTRNLKTTKFKVYSVKDTTELRSEILNGNIPLPDLFVTLSVMENEYTYYYPYYGYWYGGWYWYWKSGSLKSAEGTDYYPYYPYYPYYGYTTSYTAGTIFIDMLDASKLKPIDEETPLPIVWNGVINGIESGSTSDHAKRITTQVDQCFAQSSYLN